MFRHYLQLLSDEQLSCSVIGSGAVKHPPAKKKSVTIYASKNTVKQIIKQLSNSKNKFIINIIIQINNAQNINSPGAVAHAAQASAQGTQA